MLIFLYLNGACNISCLVETVNIHHSAAIAAIRKATDLKLITSDYSEESSYRVRKLVLTDKGRKIAEHLSEINDILSR